MGTTKRPDVGARFREKQAAMQGKSTGPNKKVQQLLGKRKQIMRRLTSMDEKTDREEMKALREEAKRLYDEASQLGISLEDAYAVATCW